MGAMLL